MDERGRANLISGYLGKGIEGIRTRIIVGMSPQLVELSAARFFCENAAGSDKKLLVRGRYLGNGLSISNLYWATLLGLRASDSHCKVGATTWVMGPAAIPTKYAQRTR